MEDHRTDVLIIGGGIIGIASAYHLLEAGCTVRLIDQGKLGKGASWANCGLVTPSHAPPLTAPGMPWKALRWMLSSRSPLYIRPTVRPSLLLWLLKFARHCNARDMMRATAARAALLNSSRPLYEQLMKKHGLECDWEARGLLLAFRSEPAMRDHDSIDDQLAELGVESRRLSGDELRDTEPALRDDVVGARLYPVDAHLRPDLLVEEWSRVIREMGARIEEDRAMTGLSERDGAVERIETAQGPLRADEYVLATGAWSPRLATRLRLEIPIQPGKGYSITMDRPERCPRYPLILAERNMCVTPWRSGYRLGGTMEFAGYDSRLDSTRIEAILSSAAEYLREPTGRKTIDRWYGWRPMTYDEIPRIGRSPVHANLTVAAGHGMLGVSTAPATGKLVAEIVTKAIPHVDPSPYALR